MTETKYKLYLAAESKSEWTKAVMDDFPSFLQDHADCERKASAMAMSFVAKFPDRKEIIPELIDIAIEELGHFRSVYALMQKNGIPLPAKMPEDLYIKQLISSCRSGREERALDRMLVASVVETRGAERFRLISEAQENEDLKKFYHALFLSEEKHGNVYVEMADLYFDQNEIEERLDFLIQKESEIIQGLEIRAALH